MEEEKKVTVTLKKELLSFEKAEIKAKRKRKILLVLLCIFLFVGGLGLGYGLTYLRIGSYYIAHSNSKFDEIKEYLENVWLYKDEYDDLDTLIEDKAYYGMTAFDEDPYTTYMSKEENNSFVSSINMNYVGIGVQYYAYNGEAIVTRVFKESPAENAGILKGDILYKVDDKCLSGLSSDEIKEIVLGEEGTSIKMTVIRNGEELELMVVRGAVDSTIYAELKGDVVYLNIMSFGENTANECIKYLEDYHSYEKLIIDLRDDSGGLQTSVASVAGLFLGEGVVYMNQNYAGGYSSSDTTTSAAYYDNFKDIVILINSGTASAAEVLTLALKEQHENVTIIGETSYGKGVVQSRYYLSDGSTLKITTSDWTSPNGVSINGEGIKPDEEVLLDDLVYLTIPEMAEDGLYEIDSVSTYVAVIEKSLNYLGYHCSRTDGYFDQDLADVLIQYASNNGLETKDYLDKELYDTILKEVSYHYTTDETKDLQMNRALEVLK